MADKINIRGLTLDQLKEHMLVLGVEAYRYTQVVKWLYAEDVTSFDQMTNLSQSLRGKLTEKYEIKRLPVLATQRSVDGTTKYLMGLADDKQVECVWIPSEDRNTLCISSQVGCGMGCTFCLTATMGMIRNLTVFEIVEQVMAIRRQLPAGARLTNIVFMGMGEPLANPKNLYPALKILQEPLGLNFSRHHITVSTSGLAPEIERFGEHADAKLAISLNATTDTVRDAIMPVNRAYPLARLLAACRKTHLPSRNKLTFEYVMLGSVNDSHDDARRLARLLKGLPAKINLIPYNDFPGAPYRRPTEDEVLSFQKILWQAGYVVNVRQSRGRDILGACGQLAFNNSPATWSDLLRVES